MSDTKDLLVRIDANTTGYERSIARAEAATHSFDYSLRQADRAAAEQQRALAAQAAATEKLGRGMLVAGTAVAAGLALSAKAAIDWESQWTSVAKVLDGTPDQLAAVEQGLRDLSKQLPTTHEDLAKIAASAGALGISTPHVVEFTKTVAMLGETTNLVGDQGATTLARFANIMGTSQGDINNIASALVALGNNGASTEAEIAALGLRLAAAGKNAGLSEGQVLGLANAMSSLGIEAEAGGSAMSRTFQMMDVAVKSGGDGLKKFAAVAGVSAAQFAREYGQDAAGALTKFLEGLGRIKDTGGNVYQVLSDLGIVSARQIDTLTRLAGAGDLLSKSLKLGAVEYQRNMALTDEFAKRNATTAAQLDRARNAAVDFAIDLGNTLLPVIGAAAQDLSALLGFFQAFPQPVKEVATVMASAGAATLLLGGAMIYTRAKVVALMTTMREANAAGTGMSRSMLAARGAAGLAAAGLAGLASQVGDTNSQVAGLATVASGAALGFAVGGPWGAAIGGAGGLLAAFGQANAAAKSKVDELTATLNTQTGAITQNSQEWVRKQLLDSGALANADALGLNLKTVTEAAYGQADAVRAVTDALAIYATSGGPENPDPAGFSDKAAQARDLEHQLSATFGIVTQGREQWRLLAESEGSAAGAGSKTAAGMYTVGAAAGDATDSINTLVEALHNLNDATLTDRGSLRAYQAALDDADAALKANGHTLNIHTDAGRANAAALDGIAAAAIAHADAMDKDGASIRAQRGYLKDARAELFDTARQFGLTKAQADAYVESVLGIPTAVKTSVNLETQRAKTQAELLKQYIEGLNPTLSVSVAAGLAGKLVANPDMFGRTRATGGLVTGPGGPREDKAGLYALSNREYVHSAAAVDYYGVGFMDALNARAVPRMADGGTPGGDPRPALTMGRLLALLARPQELTTIADVNKLIRERNQEERDLTAALSDQKVAREKVRDLAHDESASDKARAGAAKDLQKAEQAVTDQRSQLADATSKWKDAQAALLEQTKAYAATVSSMGDAFGGDGTSLTAQGLIAKKLAAGTAGQEFETYLRVLTRKHLDADLIAELRAQGPTSDGLALAQSLAQSSGRQIARLNRADNRLDSVARDVGTFGVGGRGSLGGGHDRGAPIVNIERMYAADPDKASKAIEKTQRKALAIARLG